MGLITAQYTLDLNLTLNLTYNGDQTKIIIDAVSSDGYGPAVDPGGDEEKS